MSEEQVRQTMIDPPADVPPERTPANISPERMVALLELEILERLEAKLVDRLKKRWGWLTAVVGIVAALGIWAFIQSRIESIVQAAVNEKAATAIEPLKAQAQEAMEAGQRARIAAEKFEEDARETQEKWDDLAEKIASHGRELEHQSQLLRAFFEGTRTESFRLGKSDKIIAIPPPQGNDLPTLIWMLLERVPIKGSLRVQWHIFSQPPGSYFSGKRNVLVFSWKDDLSKLQAQDLYVTYASDDEAPRYSKLSQRPDGIYADEEKIQPLVPANP